MHRAFRACRWKGPLCVVLLCSRGPGRVHRQKYPTQPGVRRWQTKDGDAPKAHTRAFEGHIAQYGILMEEQKGRLFVSDASKGRL